MSAGGLRCRSHVPTLFAYVVQNLAWIRKQLGEIESTIGNAKNATLNPYDFIHLQVYCH